MFANLINIIKSQTGLSTADVVLHVGLCGGGECMREDSESEREYYYYI